jgi:hypothetical protein
LQTPQRSVAVGQEKIGTNDLERVPLSFFSDSQGRALIAFQREHLLIREEKKPKERVLCPAK